MPLKRWEDRLVTKSQEEARLLASEEARLPKRREDCLVTRGLLLKADQVYVCFLALKYKASLILSAILQDRLYGGFI